LLHGKKVVIERSKVKVYVSTMTT